MKKTIEYYMGLNYPIEISRLSQEDGGGYYACIPQLGRYAFQGDGETLEEALKELESSKRVMFESLLAEGVEIPEPKNEDESDYSGKFIVRMPKSLHRSLAERAEAEGVSLNQFVVSLLSSSAAVYGFEAATKACIKALEDGISVRSKQFRRANRKLEKV
ncbi:MAG: type II toxin-antitoxin system HicB family antitoxin [Chloroherpetonaceae bacterium]